MGLRRSTWTGEMHDGLGPGMDAALVHLSLLVLYASFLFLSSVHSTYGCLLAYPFYIIIHLPLAYLILR